MVARWHLGRAWSQIIYDYPVPVFVISIVVTSILPLINLYFNRVLLSENAEVVCFFINFSNLIQRNH